eukprot:scaffold1445_cov235-Pinguiococcus_pyrenoidosus.AAC.6
MPGGVLQLVAYGAQDVLLSGNPQVTYFMASYRRHTHFAMESIECTFNGQPDFGQRVTCEISRNGDMVHKMYLQVTLPEINQTMANAGGTEDVYARWLSWIGEHMIKSVELEIGGTKIDKHHGEWIHIWHQLTMTESKMEGYKKMVGQTMQLQYVIDPGFSDIDTPCTTNAHPQACTPRNALPETTLYIPLCFFFTMHPGLSLPLIALSFHQVKIHVEFRPLDECLWAMSALTSGDKVTAAYNQSLVSASIYADYIFLDTAERRRTAQQPRELLITQIQNPGEDTIGTSTYKVRLNFNHPLKSIHWVVQPDANVDYCASLDNTQPLYLLMGAQPHNYTDALDALVPSLQAYGSGTAVGAKAVGGADGDGSNNFIDPSGFFADGAADVSAVTGTFPTSAGLGASTAATTSSVSDAGIYVIASAAMDKHCWGVNPVVTAKLRFNGQDRFSERDGTYFDTVQPYQHFTRCPDTGINSYSFALKPEEFQPSGSANASRLDNITLDLVLTGHTVEGTNTAKVKTYAQSQNSMRFTSGMGGLSFAS